MLGLKTIRKYLFYILVILFKPNMVNYIILNNNNIMDILFWIESWLPILFES